MDKKNPSSSNKRAIASKKKARNGLSECAEEFRKELFKAKKNTKGVFVRDFALNVDRRVTILVIVSVTLLPPWEKAGRI